MASSTDRFHPDLRGVARWLPRSPVGPRTLRVTRALSSLPIPPPSRDATVETVGAVAVRVHRPPGGGPRPAMLWIHGGGYVMGTAAQNDAVCRYFASALDIVVAAVDYRLAPESPFPLPLHDCHDALSWLAGRPDVDPHRIAVGGASAGGGLAAAVALLARERGEVELVHDLQALAIRSIQASALATIDLFEAVGSAQTAGELASKQFELARRRRETVNGGLVDFLESARNLVSMMIDPLNRRLSALSGAVNAERGPPETGDSILSRLNTLTSRQKGVLELVAEGLPNKVIAHQLGISETTVKAHVGEVLRKLKVYNRARAIVMLSQFDMRRIRSLPIGDDAESA